ncbi:MAG: dialkylresorcinol condensing enzyme [Candidatus Obscuribacterales bacterium]|nr:dialkylresorcinol condensing enzyme [Steroidobacteraceae bacterium]
MKRVLVVHFSQTGQLRDIVDSVVAPLRSAADIEVTAIELRPVTPFPFPWPFWYFFNTFPECVYEEPEPIENLSLAANAEFDLIILAYTVWFVSPNMPTMAFLQSDAAKRLLRDKPVITLIGCRNMWMMAQERVKEHLTKLGAHLIDNIALVDLTDMWATFISTPMWMLTGKRGPFLGGRVARAGVPLEEIKRAQRFGAAIAKQLPQRRVDDASPMLTGLGAVTINESLLASEPIVRRSFKVWGGLLRALGNRQSIGRRIVLGLYVLFLITLILTVVPISAVIKALLKPLTRERVKRQRAYFAAPSGEAVVPAVPQHSVSSHVLD